MYACACELHVSMCTRAYPAHHELESVVIITIVIILYTKLIHNACEPARLRLHRR